MTILNDDCKKLSIAVYGNYESLMMYDENEKYAPAGWTRSPVNQTVIEVSGTAPTGNTTTITTASDLYYRDLSTGFEAAAYRSTTGKIIISYRGTDSPLDILVDGYLATNHFISQVSKAEEFFLAVIEQYCKNADGTYDTSKVTLTGHSLGGALAQVIGAENNITTYTYNAPGMLDSLSLYSANSGNYSQITNYVTMNDYVGNYGAHVGTTYYVQPIPIGNNSVLHTTGNVLYDTHTSILHYTEQSFGQLYSASELGGFTQQQALSLWYYDANNNLTGQVGSNILNMISEPALKAGIDIINNSIGSPLNILKYSTPTISYTIGTAEKNTLNGKFTDTYGFYNDDFNDQIYGNEGNDSIKGLGGNDTIYGDNEVEPTDTIAPNCKDSIDGGSGDDLIYGGQGSDTIHGGDNNDTIYGDNEVINQNIDGGADSNVLSGCLNTVIKGRFTRFSELKGA